ncbi:MAG: hypothetical protein ACRELG_09480 [Gemmataceae bacterium]
MTWRSLYFAVISLALQGGIVHAQDDIVADFKTRAISEWDVLSKTITSIRGEETRESFSSQNRQPLWLTGRQKYKNGFRQDAGWFSEFEMEDFDEKGVPRGKYHVLTLANDDYSAKLTWKKGGEGWLLTDLKMGSDNDAMKRIRETTVVFSWMIICDNVSVPDLIRDPGFVISRIEELAGKPGSKPLRVHFRNGGWQEQSANGNQCVQSGFIDFDAGHAYRIRGYQVHWKDRDSEGDRKGVMEYEEGEGIPLLKTMVQEWPEQHSKKRGLVSSKVATSFKNTYNSGPSDEEFRLSHYGLPEPMGVKPLPKSRTWLWVLAAAVATAALAILFAWLKRRQTRTAAGSSSAL